MTRKKSDMAINIKEMIFELVGCDFKGEVQEITKDGVYVSYKDGKATVGGDTIPGKCRAYTLLAKAISEGKREIEISEKPSFKSVGPMLDMSRGGVMRVESVKKYLRYIAAHGLNMLMLYTEDTYEVKEYPYLGYQRGRYTLEELREIDDYAAELGIEVIPCIQTLGHLEQFLRYFMGIDGSIKDTECDMMVGEEDTYRFVEACVATMRQAFRSKRIHIGCDETNGMGTGNYLNKHGYRDRLEVFTEHVTRVNEICRKYDFRPMIWSDMYFVYSAGENKGHYNTNIQIPQRIVDIMPDIDLVYWDYGEGESTYDHYRINIEKHKQLTGSAIFAGIIWTCGGFVPDYRLTCKAMHPALKASVDVGTDMVIATLWGNDGCETNQLLGIPLLALYSEYCWRGGECADVDIWRMIKFMTGLTPELSDAVSDFFCDSESMVNPGKAVLWSDPLINLLSYNYDLEEIEGYLIKGLKVIETYEHTEYFAAVFRAALDKCRLHMYFRTKYKAGDREYLRNLAECDLPKMIADFEKLRDIHCNLWLVDYKANGWERIQIRYAATLERTRYTIRVINDYLDGKLDVIEELEPELFKGTTRRYRKAKDFMYTSV